MNTGWGSYCKDGADMVTSQIVLQQQEEGLKTEVREESLVFAQDVRYLLCSRTSLLALLAIVGKKFC